MDYDTDSAALAVITGASSPVAIALARQLSAWQFDLLLVAEDDGVHWVTRLLQSEGRTADGIKADLRTSVGVSLVHEELVGRGEQVQVLVLDGGLMLARRVLPHMIRARSGCVLVTDSSPQGMELYLREQLAGTSVTVSRLAPLAPGADPEEFAWRAIDAMMVAEVQALSRAL
jgi:NADP-dependent 3-hydroxy acid dehydrogenase YdfG